MNLEAMQSEVSDISSWAYIQGIFYGIIALTTWTWYVVYNSQFIQKHPEVNSYQWTALVGFMTLVFTVVVIAGRFMTLGSDHFYQFHWEHESGRLFHRRSPHIRNFLFLGSICFMESSKLSPSTSIGGTVVDYGNHLWPLLCLFNRADAPFLNGNNRHFPDPCGHISSPLLFHEI